MKSNSIKPPSKKQLLNLRLMIVIGLVCMFFFMHSLLRTSVVGYKPLYWMLIVTFVYTFFKVIYEWYHYWSISVPATPPVTRQYTVDVFTTFCAGEPYEMILETLTAIQNITYPHETYLCDEANDPYLKEVCGQLGVHHITRVKKTDAKAGNINNALAQSSGELCVVLDPDHVPFPEFLDPIVSHFDNPEIGYVQVVQAYYNQRIGWIAKGAAQQTYHFYGPMMMCMNSYGTVQAIGANCTFRRTALESIGGHAAGLAEDMHTAMQLHAKQWKSVYVPQVLARGLVPATLSAYYKQQIKWSRGVFELLVTSYVKLFTKFTWRQKIHYGLLPFFYLSGFIFLINFSIPVLSLFMNVYPLKMDFSDFLVISVPFITSVILIRHFVQEWVMEDNERGFHAVGGLLLIGTWWIFILGFIYTIIRKNVPYIPTPKDVKDEKNLKNNLPNIAVLVISLSAIACGLYSDWSPFTLFMSAIALLNCLFMVFMLIASSELKLQMFLGNHNTMFNIVSNVKTGKKHFWLLRRRVYTGVRKVNLILTVFVICISVYVSREDTDNGADVGNAGNYSVLHNGENSIIKPGSADTAGLWKIINQQQLYAPAARPALLPADSNKTVTDRLTQLKNILLNPHIFPAVKGVIYPKGHYWYKNISPLTKKIIVADFKEMRAAGVNTIKIYGPNIYDHSTFEAAAQQGLKIHYSFWIPDAQNFIDEADNLDDVAKLILKTINKNKTNADITAWNLGNSSYQQLSSFYHTPQLFYAQYHYIRWLKQLVNDIKLADPTRPLTFDVLPVPALATTLNLLHAQIPAIDAFGLIIKDKPSLKYITTDITAPYFISNANPISLKNAAWPRGGIFYASWQDQQSGPVTTFDGLKDVWGRNKPYLHQISMAWHGTIPDNNLPPVRILKPALTTNPGASLPYSALIYAYNKWNVAAYLKTNLRFEWYLVKIDAMGSAINMSKIGDGPTIYVNIPPGSNSYRLYMVAVNGNNANNDYVTLNTPLKN
ncbi:glycosyltransferase family 2 protein [Mucilaginibacter ginsenosidivorax]|uniref:Glycosyltransferase n=1 Tax=Mucilaginibacter ginsenosidivorax TaxID=862126 RepID=A0A5B8W604_9SPHI|nr:cellulose synthase catalytic subunit [Mucilaginibacter ginsenosidivorax]QEC77668.1 glycosyltransferase [Mucilaginibacter ginsenosidivorax]